MDYDFPTIYGNVMLPTDEFHHFSEGWRKTTNQIMMNIVDWLLIIACYYQLVAG